MTVEREGRAEVRTLYWVLLIFPLTPSPSILVLENGHMVTVYFWYSFSI